MSGDAPPIMAIMAVAKMQKVHQSLLEVAQKNTWTFNVGELRFWLSVSIGKKKGRGKKKLSNKNVFLYPQSWCFNAASSKLEGI